MAFLTDLACLLPLMVARPWTLLPVHTHQARGISVLLCIKGTIFIHIQLCIRSAFKQKVPPLQAVAAGGVDFEISFCSTLIHCVCLSVLLSESASARHCLYREESTVYHSKAHGLVEGTVMGGRGPESKPCLGVRACGTPFFSPPKPTLHPDNACG